MTEIESGGNNGGSLRFSRILFYQMWTLFLCLHCKTIFKKFADFIIIFFALDRFNRFNLYLTQTDKQANRQTDKYIFYIIKQDIRIYIFLLGGQTAGPNGMTFFDGTRGYSVGNIGKKLCFKILNNFHGQRQAKFLLCFKQKISRNNGYLPPVGRV